MTTTLPQTSIPQTSIPQTSIPQTSIPQTSTTWSTGIDLLRSLLDDALDAVAELEPDRLHGRTPAGEALLALSGIARRAAAALGAAPGVELGDGPGVVVVRDLVTATRLLARTAARPTARPADELVPLVAAAKGVHARLRDVLTAGG